jgi:hypothetical protein
MGEQPFAPTTFMTSNLSNALRTLITESLPNLFGGDSPPLTLNFSRADSQFDRNPSIGSNAVSEPRGSDRLDSFPFTPDNPNYRLTQSPYPGARRVSLVTADGDLLPLTDTEIIWDETDSQNFFLNLRSNRDLNNITQIEVLYSVTAVFTTVDALESVSLTVESSDPQQSEDEAQLDRATALIIAVVELNRPRLINDAQIIYESENYRTQIIVKNLKLTDVNSSESNQRQLNFTVDTLLQVSRTLGTNEGRAIEGIILRSSLNISKFSSLKDIY